MIIPRKDEIERLKKGKKWKLIYGRRKTGKTFLIRNFGTYDEYFFVKKDRTIISEKQGLLSYDIFMNLFGRLLDENKKVVVDEFHRLGNGFFDFLHYNSNKGNLILVSSTLFLSKKILAEKSSLIGLFEEFNMGLISLRDVLRELKKFEFSYKEMMEIGVLLREPIAVDYFEKSLSSREMIFRVFRGSIKTVPALIGEIFVEEEREISAIYEGILRSIAGGKMVSGEISSYLFSKKLIGKDNPSFIQQHLNNLISIGILKRVRVFQGNKYLYKHVSPLAQMFYYADEKYNVSEREVSDKEIEEIISVLLPKIIEDNVRSELAKKEGLIEGIIEGRDYEIDICLLKFKKPVLVGEVKWGKIDNNVVENVLEVLSKQDVKDRVLFVPDKKDIGKIKSLKGKGIEKKEVLRVLDVRDLF